MAIAVAGGTYVLMVGFLMLSGLLPAELFPAGGGPSESWADPLNPSDMVLFLGTLALMIPASILGVAAGWGRPGIIHSVFGRFRWRLLALAAIVIVPIHLLLNTGLLLFFEREAIVVPQLTASVILSWVVILILVPLQSAGEEYLFRGLPLLVMGSWLRSPLWGLLLPIPLFMFGHGYAWLGQVHLAVFSLAMGLLVWKTGGLELAILMHAANNLSLFLLAPVVPGMLDQGEVSWLGFGISTGPMLVMTAGLWWWYSRRAGLRILEPQRTPATRR